MINVHFKLVQYFFNQKMSVLEIPPSEDSYYEKSKKMVLG